MRTLEQIMAGHCEVPDHLVADGEIPVIATLQIQGDVAIIPSRAGADLGELVPADGIAVVRGEAGGNTHLLVGDGTVRYCPTDSNVGLDCGVVTVDEGAVGYLLHREHGANAFAPGSYLFRRQREQADEIRRVTD